MTLLESLHFLTRLAAQYPQARTSFCLLLSGLPLLETLPVENSEGSVFLSPDCHVKELSDADPDSEHLLPPCYDTGVPGAQLNLVPWEKCAAPSDICGISLLVLLVDFNFCVLPKMTSPLKLSIDHQLYCFFSLRRA